MTPALLVALSITNGFLLLFCELWRRRSARSTDLALESGERLVRTQKQLMAAQETLLDVGGQLLSTQMQHREAMREVASLKREVNALRAANASDRSAFEDAWRLKSQLEGEPKGLGIDEQTRSLVRLAINNPEAQEGAAAAMIVCKRLKELMG